MFVYVCMCSAALFGFKNDAIDIDMTAIDGTVWRLSIVEAWCGVVFQHREPTLYAKHFGDIVNVRAFCQ